MFSGEAEEVKLRFDKSLINAVIDRFGKNVSIVPDDGESFIVRVQIKTEHPEPFFGWLLQFGTKVKIVEPYKLKEKYKKQLEEVLLYE
jgi:predicted DNA-binding transcriptional regulator YafY